MLSRSILIFKSNLVLISTLQIVSYLILETDGAPHPQVEESIYNTLKEKNTTDVFLLFHKGNADEVRKEVKSARSFASTSTSVNEKRDALYKALKSNADETQSNIVKFLEGEKTKRGAKDKEKPVSTFQLWVTNQLIVYNVDKELLEELKKREDIASIKEDVAFKFSPHPRPKGTPTGRQFLAGPNDTAWGVPKIQAPEIWATGNRGQGAVVGLIDTGVLSTHESIKDNFRSHYGWFEPRNYSSTPFDYVNHGTAVTSIAVGRTRVVGVAPDAQWIACRSITTRDLTQMEVLISDTIACLQWMSCPTDIFGQNANCSLAPNVVSNSYGLKQGVITIDPYINQLTEHNIVSIFGGGNNGPECGTAISPADSEATLGVGATNSSNLVADFSSVGPAVVGNRTKPDVSAPGEDILQASNTAETHYLIHSGTSMAAPHVAGLAALYYSHQFKRKRQPTVSEFRKAVIRGVLPTIPTGRNCGGIPETTYPNNVAGHGIINAPTFFKALERIIEKASSNASNLPIRDPIRQIAYLILIRFLLFFTFE